MAGDENTAIQIASQSDAASAVKQAVNGAQSSNGDGLFAQLSGNPFFTAGFGLAAVAFALKTGQSGLKYGADLLRRRMLVDIEITRRDEAYPWLLQWMSAHQRAQLSAATGTHVRQEAVSNARRGIIAKLADRVSFRMHHLQVATAQVAKSDGSLHTNFALVPGPGRHILRYGPAFIMVDRQREKAFDVNGVPFETMRLTTLYSFRHVFEDIFMEAHQLAQQSHEGKTVIYTSKGIEWKPFGEPKRKRPIDSVVLEEGVKERIVADVKSFLDTRIWYMDRGIPHRRGYLLYGPPGTGKSSFIQALAGELDFNIAMLNVSERGLTDDRLNHLLSTIPPRTIVLLEDADAAFVNRRQADETGYAGGTVTFSGLLNALDGVASAEGRIIFLTTNHVERMDEALIRPGRVDMTVRLGEATAYQIENLWDRFYGEYDTDGSGKKLFMERVAELGLAGHTSTAALQGLFLYNKDNFERAIEMAGELAPEREPPSTYKAARA